MELIAQISAIIVLFGSVIGLFFKLRAIDANLSSTVNAKISAREKIRKDLEDQQKVSDKELSKTEDKLYDAKFGQLWQKLNSLDTQINGSPQYKVKGLVVTIAELKMVIKNLGGHVEDE